ncbi:ArsR/SmtB family transcription factor [Oryzomonas japonica]|nr:metalloregulator ArsR/SmtB family transcription factor [Oryzomonas japonica]
MALENLPSRLYQQFAHVGQALASPQRIQIINLLCQSARSVDELADELGQSAANTSAHLKVLREAHLIEIRREGRKVYCSLTSNSAIRLWMALRDFGMEEIPEVREMMREYAQEDVLMEQVVGKDVLDMVRAGDALLLDIRPASEFEAGHLPLARSMPFDELEARLAELPRDKIIVIYRRSPFCVGSVKAVDLLKKAGFQAKRLHGGVAEWRAAGRPLEGMTA